MDLTLAAQVFLGPFAQHHDACEAGAEVVVDVFGDAPPLAFDGIPLFEQSERTLQSAVDDIANASAHARDNSEHHSRTPPPRLPKMGFKREDDGCPALVPRAVLVAGQDAETVTAGSNIIVVSNPASSGIHPIRIDS